MAGRVAYYGNISKDGLIVHLDAAKNDSYPKIGTSWTDISGYSNNATLVNGPIFDSSDGGGSIVFDGVDDSASGSYINSGANNTSMITWYKWNGVNQLKSIGYLGNGGVNGYGMIINNGTNTGTAGNRISVLYGGSFWNALDTGTTSATLSSNVYSQLVLTRDTTTTRLYQNGSFLGSTTRTPNSVSSNLSYILTDPGLGGSISFMQFYNRTLSASEILQNYNALKGRYGL